MNSVTLPTSWVWTTLGEIAEIIGGGTPSREKPDYFTGDIVWLTPTQIPKDKIISISDSKERITPEAIHKSSARLVPKDSVMMTSRASIGYVAIAGTEVTTNQGFASFVCKNGICNYYLAYWLWANAGNFIQEATGTTFKEITKSKLRTFAFPLPPYDEQVQIVEHIESQFTQLEAGVEGLKRVQAGLKRYKASVLKAACEGKLLNSGNGGLKLGEEKLPEGWKLVKWGDLISLAQNGFGKRRSDSGSPTIVLRLADIVDNNISLNDVRRIGATEDEITKYELVKNDLICIRVNGSLDNVGRMVLFHNANETVTFCDHFIRYRMHEPEMASFYAIYFDTDRARKYIELNRVSSAGQNTISQGTLANFEIPLPPLLEQKQIMVEVERRISIMNGLEQEVSDSLKRAARMRQAILKKAFEGKLLG